MFSDQDLRSYLDGAATNDLAQRIEAALAEDAALEDRLMAMDEIAPVIRKGLDQLPSPSDAQITAWTHRAAPKAQGWSWLAAGVLIGAIAVGGAWWMAPPETPGWRSAVATYQGLYSKETVADLSFSEAELEQQLSEAEARIGANGLYQLVSNLDGLQLRRSQILAHNGKPLVQIVFVTEEGEPVALCLMQASPGQREGIDRVATLEGMSSLAFDSGEHSWILIGTQDNAFIEATGQELGTRLGINA